MNIKMLAALAATALLAACADTPPATDTGAAAGSGTTVPTATGPVAGSQEDLKRIGDRVFFDFDRSALKEDSRAQLDRQADWLKQYMQNNVQVAGNCDERGTEEYNIALGNRRARAARDYLVAKGIAASRITTISYGKDRPSALGSTEDAWAQNRNAITSVR